MNNIMLDGVPSEWNGYTVNTDFRIGLQIAIAQDDQELTAREKTAVVTYLLFGNDDGTLRDYPADISEVVSWFMSGWHTDKQIESDSTKRLIDYDIDQWRIYADFMQIYHIDLSTANMHWWTFNGLLWNMPVDLSSFMGAIQIRQKKPRKGASLEERKAIERGHKIYDLDERKKEYTSEEKNAIDDFDRFMREIEAKKKEKANG